MHPALQSLLRAHVADAPRYVSAAMAADKDADLTFLNANENPYELPGLEGLNRYPQPQPPKLLRALAALYGVPPECVMVGRGEDEAIQVLTRLLCEPHRDAIVQHPPTFGMYAVDAGLMPARVVDVPLINTGTTFALDEAGVVEAGRGAKIVYICSPNNPTGTSFPHAQIRRIARALEGHALVVVDEAYAEFSAQGSLAPHLAAHPNMAILRTLSKAYSLTAARVGALLCADADFIALCAAKGLDAYPLPRPSIAAAMTALSDNVQGVARANIRAILAERDRFREAIRPLPAVGTIYDSDANYLLLEIVRAKEFWQHCFEAGIVLRDLSDKPGLDGTLRISIGTPAEMARVEALLAAWAP
jgi:histidinol-phosphate aminotransferase